MGNKEKVATAAVALSGNICIGKEYENASI